MEEVCVEARTPAVIIKMGSTIQPLACMAVRSGSYLASLEACVAVENLSLQ
jgi:hypothetical protein